MATHVEHVEQEQRETAAFTVWPDLEPLVEPLALHLPQVLRPAPGRPAVSNSRREMLRTIPPRDLALAVVRGVVTALLTPPTDTSRRPGRPVQEVGSAVGHHVLNAYLRAGHPGLTSRQAALYVAAMQEEGTLTPANMTGIGFHLLYALQHTTAPGLLAFHAPRRPSFRKDFRSDAAAARLSLAPEAVAHYGLSALRRLHVQRPMLAPPRPWSALQRGGYAYALADSVPLVRNVSALDADPTCPQVVYDTLNPLQETAWRINEGVLTVAQQLQERLTAEERLVLAEAADEAGQAALYFVHSLDFCGRIYPLGTYLTPQGPDLARALLCFANVCTITAQDGPALAALDRYGEQCLGSPLDPITVARIARGPVETQPVWWAAKKRWQYLAFCRERTALADAHAAGKPYVSALPVWQDALANGLQHMALLLRDSELAPLVSLMPNAPRDVYEDVATRMSAHLWATVRDFTKSMTSAEAGANHPAEELLAQYGGTITRDVAKMPTMLFGYGGTQRGIWDRFVEDRGLNAAEARSFTQAAWAVLTAGVMARAFQLRRWFRTVGWAIGQTGNPAAWIVPGTTFPAVQRNCFKAKEARLLFQWDSVTPPPRLRVFNGRRTTLDKSHHATSLAPNVIHSLDAAHLMLTVTQLPPGVSIGTVHDSFATRATEAATLERAFKSAFMTLYGDGQNPLQDLAQQFRRQCAKMPAPPEQGRLTISAAMFQAAKPLR